jgi:hypothetical protein
MNKPLIKNVGKMSERELRCEVLNLRETVDRIHKHAVAHWSEGVQRHDIKGVGNNDGWLKVMQLSDPGAA